MTHRCYFYKTLLHQNRLYKTMPENVGKRPKKENMSVSLYRHLLTDINWEAPKHSVIDLYPSTSKCTLGKEHQTDSPPTRPLSSLWGDLYYTCKRIKVSLKGGQFVYISIIFWQAKGQIKRRTNGKTKYREKIKPRKKLQNVENLKGTAHKQWIM